MYGNQNFEKPNYVPQDMPRPSVLQPLRPSPRLWWEGGRAVPEGDGGADALAGGAGADRVLAHHEVRVPHDGPRVAGTGQEVGGDLVRTPL